jgi:hypothetical protein
LRCVVVGGKHLVVITVPLISCLLILILIVIILMGVDFEGGILLDGVLVPSIIVLSVSLRALIAAKHLSLRLGTGITDRTLFLGLVVSVLRCQGCHTVLALSSLQLLE